MNLGDTASAAARIIEERKAKYPEFEAQWTTAATVASALTGKALTPLDIALVQVALKLARFSHGVNEMDNLVDLCGYADIAAVFKEAQKENLESADKLIGKHIGRPDRYANVLAVVFKEGTAEKVRRYKGNFKDALRDGAIAVVLNDLSYWTVTEGWTGKTAVRKYIELLPWIDQSATQ